MNCHLNVFRVKNYDSEIKYFVICRLIFESYGYGYGTNRRKDVCNYFYSCRSDIFFEKNTKRKSEERVIFQQCEQLL